MADWMGGRRLGEEEARYKSRRRRRKEDDRCDTSNVYKEKLMRNREKEREWEKKKKNTP